MKEDSEKLFLLEAEQHSRGKKEGGEPMIFVY
jgi:hypothetical protein